MATVRPGSAAHQARPGTGPIHYARDLSGGVNLSTSRESIRDNEAWWMEGLMPQAPGNLAVLPGAGFVTTGINSELSPPSYTMSFCIGAQIYVFAVWRSTGNAWVGQPGGLFTKIATGKFLSGATAAASWNGQGIVIVDSSTGYYDYNITSANTLTSLSNSVQAVTLTSAGAGYTSAPTVNISGGGGSGASAGCTIGLASAAIAAGGTGYVVGDVITINTNFGSAGQFPVTSVSGTGAITGIGTITRLTASGPTLANPVAGVGGTGTGATFNCTCNLNPLTLITMGSGYTSTPTVSFTGGTPVTAASATATVSGSLTGTDIETYAGRVWIASGRTVTFTDAGSYNSFVGSGSSFTIQDSYLTGNLTALYAANNYLYIFGPTSIDLLSNVTVSSAGVANFSRVNISPSVGTTHPNSIFGFNRSIMFANVSGFWRLSGATPECISDGKIDLLIPQIAANAIYGATFAVNNLLCAGFLIQFTDIFTQNSVTSWMLCIYYNGRWFFDRQTTDGSAILALGGIATWLNSNVQSIVGWAGSPSTLYVLFSPGNNAGKFWKLRTKLYDMAAPMASKQGVRAGFGGNFSSAGLGNIAFSIDTAFGNGAAMTVALPNGYSGSGYASYLGDAVTQDGAKYVGFGMTGGGSTTPLTRLDWLALEYKETNEWQ